MKYPVNMQKYRQINNNNDGRDTAIKFNIRHFYDKKTIQITNIFAIR